jgi:hypothetical protein
VVAGNWKMGENLVAKRQSLSEWAIKQKMEKPLSSYEASGILSRIKSILKR